MKLFLAKIGVSIGLAIASLFGYTQPVQETPKFGATFTPVQASQFTLAGSGITSSATSIQLTSFTLPDPNRTPITMSMIGSIGYLVLEPQSNKIENVTFTGVVQNANGSATLTGVSRGISFYSPYNASSTLAMSHAGGAYAILSNSAAFYGKEFLFANNISTSSAGIIFSSTTPPRYDLVPANQALGTYVSTTSELVSWAGLQAVAIAGSANATESVKGISELATQSEMSTSALTGSTGASAVLYSKYSTSTPVFGTGSYIPITRSSDNKLSPNFIATSSTDIYNFATLNIASSTIASSTIYTLNVGNINATSTIRGTFSGNGSAITNIPIPRYSFADQTDLTANSNDATASTTFMSIPANTLTASSTIEIAGFLVSASNGGGASTCKLSVRKGTGETFTTTTVNNGNGDSRGTFNAQILSKGSSSSQQSFIRGLMFQGNTPANSTNLIVEDTSSFDMTQAFTIGINITAGSANVSSCVLSNWSVVVNP